MSNFSHNLSGYSPTGLVADKDFQLDANPMLPIQRRQRIASFLQQHGAVSLQQLTEALHVSMSTLRRDLDQLAEEGLIERTHGGAVLRTLQYSTFEPVFSAARNLSPRQKALIGEAAAASLQPEQTVIFESGSTVLEAARAAVGRQIPLQAITNNIEIAQVLNTSPLIRVHVFGGQLRQNSSTLVGDSVQSAARNIRADVLFFGAHAVTENVVSETAPEVVAVKQALLRAANVRCLLVDSSKFRPRVFMSVCELPDIEEIITDDGIPPEEIEHIRGAGVRLTIVPNVS